MSSSPAGNPVADQSAQKLTQSAAAPNSSQNSTNTKVHCIKALASKLLYCCYNSPGRIHPASVSQNLPKLNASNEITMRDAVQKYLSETNSTVAPLRVSQIINALQSEDAKNIQSQTHAAIGGKNDRDRIRAYFLNGLVQEVHPPSYQALTDRHKEQLIESAAQETPFPLLSYPISTHSWKTLNSSAHILFNMISWFSTILSNKDHKKNLSYY